MGGGGAHTLVGVGKEPGVTAEQGELRCPDGAVWEARRDIAWWQGHLERKKAVRLTSPDFEISTDASHLGWGAHRGTLTAGVDGLRMRP